MIPYSQHQTYLTTVLQVLRQTLPMHQLLQETIPCSHLYIGGQTKPKPSCVYCILDALFFTNGTTTNAVKDGFASEHFHGNRTFNTEREFDALEYFMAVNFKLQGLFGSDVTDSLFSIFKREVSVCSGNPSHVSAPKITNMLGVSFQGPQEITFSLEEAVKAFFKTEETVCPAPPCGCPPALVKNQSSITSLPATLMVRIARFSETGLKNSMANVLIPHALMVQSIDEVISYRLYAVISHEGPSIKAGIFSVSLMLEEENKVNCHHLHKNRTSCRNVTDQTYFENADSHPYMMFYQAQKEWAFPPNVKHPFFIDIDNNKTPSENPSSSQELAGGDGEVPVASTSESASATVTASGDTPVHIPMSSSDKPGQWVVTQDGQIIFTGDAQAQKEQPTITIKQEPVDADLPITIKVEDDDSNQSSEPMTKRIKIEPAE
ncbi:uncharacterized protein LOC100374012 [Saccoglossus kowalevskii]